MTPKSVTHSSDGDLLGMSGTTWHHPQDLSTHKRHCFTLESIANWQCARKWRPGAVAIRARHSTVSAQMALTVDGMQHRYMLLRRGQYRLCSSTKIMSVVTTRFPVPAKHDLVDPRGCD